MIRCIFFVFFLATLASCHSPTGPDHRIPDIRSWVTGDAASALNSSGHFVFAASPPASSASDIGPDRAKDLAIAFFRMFAAPDIVLGSSIVEEWTREHGHFNINDVYMARPVYFGESPYAPLPDSLPSYIRNYLAPRFITYYAVDNRIIGTNAVSVLNSDLRIDNGRIEFGRVGGEEFHINVVPKFLGYTNPITPERAVEVVGKSTGAKTKHVPELLLPHRRLGRMFARWRLVLDRKIPVTGDSTGLAFLTDTVYVGTAGPSAFTGAPANHEQIWIALPDQPGREIIPYQVPISREARSVAVSIVRPVLFDRMRLP
jgi:hypothetical protein